MTQRARTRRRIVGTGVAVLVALGALTGCSPRGSTAAVVNGQAISASDILAVQNDLAPALGQVDTATVLTSLIQAPIVVQLAAANGDAVTNADAKSMLDSFFTDSGVTPPKSYASATMQVGLQQAAGAKLNQSTDVAKISQQFTDDLAKLNVTVNPRFGSWTAGQVANMTPSWMVSGQ